MIIKNIDEMESIREEWNNIYIDSTMRSPLLSYEYVKLWYECFAEKEDVRVFKIEDERNNDTIAFMPMVIIRNKAISILKSITNDHSFYGDAIVRKGYEELFRIKIINQMLREKEWDVLIHDYSYSFSAMYPIFSENILNINGCMHHCVVEPTYTIFIETAVDEYIKNSLSSNLKSQLKRCNNKLNKKHTYKYKHYEGQKALEYWPEFLRIEDSGWKGRNGSSILRTTIEYKKYYDGLINILSKYNRIHLYFLEVDGKNISGVFGYIADDSFDYYKIAYDEEYHTLSPSNILLIHLMNDLVKNYGINRIHLFPYDDTGYKVRFANEKSYYSKTKIYNKTIAGCGMYYYDEMKRIIAKQPVLGKYMRIAINAIRKRRMQE